MLLLAVVLMIARPVMACCWVGHGDSTEAPATHSATHSSAADRIQPPCHGGGEMPQPGVDTEQGCGNCADCDNPLLAAAELDARIAAQLLVDAVLVGFSPPRPILPVSTHAPRDGPARGYFPRQETPISLKQRLLI